MKGLKSEDERKLDEMLQSLTEEDRLIWEKGPREGASDKPLDSVNWKSRMMETIPDYEEIEAGRRDFSSEEKRKLEALIFEDLKDLFEEQGFSEDGMKKILDFTTRALGDLWK